jgi:hypothetical protein
MWLNSAQFTMCLLWIIAMRLRGAPERDPLESSLSCLDRIISVSLKSLRNGLPSCQGNQTREDRMPTWFTLQRVAANSQCLHPALEHDPRLASIGASFGC